MKKILWTIVLLALLGGGGYVYLRYHEAIERFVGVKPSPASLAGGVVTVYNSYYYHVSLPDGRTLYYSEMTDGGFENLTFSADSIVPHVVTGAGVFIDNAGTIATAGALGAPHIADGEVKLRVQDLIDRLASWAQAEQKARSTHYRLLGDSINACYDIDKNDSIIELAPDKVAQYKQRRLDLMSDILKARDMVNQLKSIDVSKVKMGCHSNVRIAYSGSKAGVDEMIPCKLVRSAGDLCLIAIPTGATPAGATVLATPSRHDAGFTAPDADERALTPVGTDVTMLASPGDQTTATRTYSGTVTQVGPEMTLVDMGNAPLCMGAPLVNEYGDMVGIIIGRLDGTTNIHRAAAVHAIENLLQQQ